MKTGTIPFSIWLVPGEEQREQLQRIIRNVSNAFDATPFMPHMTGYSVSVPSKDVETIKRDIRHRLEGSKQTRCTVTGISHSEAFFKAVYLDIPLNPSLEHIYQVLRSRLQAYGKYILQPHVSLLYQELSEEKRMDAIRIANGYNLPKELVFDEVGFVTFEGDQRKIDQWRYQKICQL